MNLDSFEKHRIDLKRPLLLMRGPKGVLACGYLNPATFTKTGEACAIVTGVSDYDEMVNAKVVSVSEAARAAGVEPGMTGGEALERFA